MRREALVREEPQGGAGSSCLTGAKRAGLEPVIVHEAANRLDAKARRAQHRDECASRVKCVRWRGRSRPNQCSPNHFAA